MPTLRFHGVDKDQLTPVLEELYERLTAIYNLPDDHINVEVINSDWLDRTGDADGYAMVEVLAFPREQRIEDQVGMAVAAVLKLADYPESELFFIHLGPKHYYCHG